MKSTTYIIEITNQKNEKYLYLRNFLHVFTEKCFAIFDQSGWAIYLTWYRLLFFFWEFSSIIPFMVWL